MFDRIFDVVSVCVCECENIPAFKIGANDIKKAIAEYKIYSDKKGSVYEESEYKEASFEEFCKIYFGECDEFGWEMFKAFSCSNKKVADSLANFFSPLKYHDRFNQSYLDIEVDGKNVFIVNGDY